MGYQAVQIANSFIVASHETAGKELCSVTKLLKLVYIAHGWHLAVTERKPLFDETIMAWKYGPVVPSVYYAFSPQMKMGGCPLKQVPAEEVALNALVGSIIRKISKKYEDTSYRYLSYLTHEPGTPWDKATRNNKLNVPIPNELIYQYYSQIVKQAREAANEQ